MATSLSRRIFYPLVSQLYAATPQRGLFKVFQSTTTSNTDKTEDQPSSSSTTSTEQQLSETEIKLKEDNSELLKKYEETLDKYRRSIAENDNMRKRLTKQIEDAKIFGIQSFVKDLLEVSDVLQKAVDAVPQEILANSDKHVKDMFEGLKLTQSQMEQVFKRHDLIREDPLNEKFDPNKHEAMFQIPAPPGIESGIVLDVQKVGYILHGRTIRPALVGVSKK